MNKTILTFTALIALSGSAAFAQTRVQPVQPGQAGATPPQITLPSACAPLGVGNSSTGRSDQNANRSNTGHDDQDREDDSEDDDDDGGTACSPAALRQQMQQRGQQQGGHGGHHAQGNSAHANRPNVQNTPNAAGTTQQRPQGRAQNGQNNGPSQAQLLVNGINDLLSKTANPQARAYLTQAQAQVQQKHYRAANALYLKALNLQNR